MQAHGVAEEDPPVTPRDNRWTGRLVRSIVSGRREIRVAVLVYALTALLVVGRVVTSAQINAANFVWTLILLSAVGVIVAYGQGLVILIGGFDLSIPSAVTIGGILLTTYTLGSNQAAIWVIPLVLAVGALIGVANGVGVAYLKLAPIVMTLAVNVILDGAILLFTNGTPQGFAPPILIQLMEKRVLGGVPIILFFLLGFIALGVILLQRTVYGRQIYAVGNSRRVARLSGVRINAIVISVYAISGMCATLGGMLLAGYSHQSALGMGDPYLLPSLAAVVIGGASVLGGRGYYLGTVGGVFLLTAIGMVLSSLSSPDAVKTIVYGFTILVSVMFLNR